MSEESLTPAHLLDFMRENAIPGEIIHLEAPTPTVEAAAKAVHTKPEQIVKTILFFVQDNPVLSVCCGTELIDRRAIASKYAVGRKQVKLASAEEVLQTTGYEVGALPPFGHRRLLPTLLDPRVLEHPLVYAGGGAENALLMLNPQDIVRVAQAEVLDLNQGTS